MNFEEFSHLDNVFTAPTPLHELPNLRKELGCSQYLYMKRDDYTGLGLGGNKVRKLKFILGQARQEGADTIITWAGLQSHHNRQTLSLAKSMGLQCHLVLEGEKPEKFTDNLLVYKLMEANLHFVKKGKGEAKAQELSAELAGKGHKPFVVPVGGFSPLGSLGYIECIKEIAEQAWDLRVKFDHVIVPSGTPDTQAGAEIGKREFYPDLDILGICISRDAETQRKHVCELINQTYEFLGSPQKSVQEKEIMTFGAYMGEKYGSPTKDGLEAIELLARTEGILLDPIYTSKSMVGMIDLIKKGFFSNDDSIVFIFSSGFPARVNLNALFSG